MIASTNRCSPSPRWKPRIRTTSIIGATRRRPNGLRLWNICDGGSMATITLTQDFREFLNLLNLEKIEYLLIGGYAVGLYGHIWPTKDMDVWISVNQTNLERIVVVLEKFGFAPGTVRADDFKSSKSVFRMGVPPNQLELITLISGVEFDDCYSRRAIMEVEGENVPVIE